jgi:acylphosphatase
MFQRLTIRAIWLAAVASMMMACAAAAPVQEMSDARQAIAAAEAADAERLAPGSLREARRLLVLAEEQLRREAFIDARDSALRAKLSAVQALEVIQTSSLFWATASAASLSEPETALRIFVDGKVQGVFYRAATVREANRRRIRGWVRNLADGRVEVVCCGSPKAIDSLIEWLWQGPERAQVVAIKIEGCAESSVAELGQGFVQRWEFMDELFSAWGGTGMCHRNRWAQRADFESKGKIAFFALRALRIHGWIIQRFI